MPRRKTAVKPRFPLALFFVLLLSAFLRFFRLGELFHWTLDEEYWAYLPLNIASGYHFPLIGGHISGTGLYSGPLFVWLMALPAWVAHGHPLGFAIFVSSLGIVTAYATYKLGTAMFDEKTGIFAALFQASSTLMTLYDRKYWNASPIPLLSLLTLFSLFQIGKGKYRWSFILAVVLALAFHAHMTSGVLLVLVVLAWVFLKLPLNKPAVIGAIGVFLALQTPLLVFEFRHEFLNTKALLRFLKGQNAQVSLAEAVPDVTRLALYTGGRLVSLPDNLDIADELTLCSQYAERKAIPQFWAIGIAVLAVLTLLIRKSQARKLLILAFLTNLAGLVWYRLRAGEGNWYQGLLGEYYLLPIFPLFFLGLGSLFSVSWERWPTRRWFFLLLAAILTISNLCATLSLSHSDGLTNKEALVNQVLTQVGTAPFSFTVETEDPCRMYGYRYLFTVKNREPVASYLDPQFLWLYEKRLPRVAATKTATILPGKTGTELRIEDVKQN